MWVAKWNCLDELYGLVVTGHPSDKLLQKSIFDFFYNARSTTLVWISRVLQVTRTDQTGLVLLHLRLWFFDLGFVDQPRNEWFSSEPPETPRTRCSLRQSPLMTRLPRSPGSPLVLRLYQETVHDFILPFLPPCGPHLTPLATGSLERSLLVFSTPGGLTGNDLSHLFFSCTNASQAATCTCNT
jgi:hypothetical protein